jgi:CheY-like chemotaxis protein/DNA-binding Xre family transcriptional regulator
MLDIVSRFGAKVKNLRHTMGISQAVLAERAGLHQTYIAGIEGGERNITLKSIGKLAGALSVSVSTLLSEEEPADGDTAAVKSRPVEILLVEDDARDLELTLEAFKADKVANAIRVAKDGREALDFLFCLGRFAGREFDKPRLVLLDLKLPKVSGVEVLRQVKSDVRTMSIPVVVLTGSQDSQALDQCLRLGAEAYIRKPVNFPGLCGVTRRLKLNWALVSNSWPQIENETYAASVQSRT